jgi:hypothetical protein
MMGARAGAALICAAVALGGCANGDFGRVKSGLVNDEVHSWVGTTAALGNGAPISSFPLTDDERALRDLAYPLIEPPYDRQRWFSFLNEYGMARIFRHNWSLYDPQTYTRVLMSQQLRSEAARYARLGDDIRNDRTRVPPFFLLATRVLDMDRRREASLGAVSYLTPAEELNAIARNAENALVISWVQWSLMARTLSPDRAGAPRHRRADAGRNRHRSLDRRAAVPHRPLPGVARPRFRAGTRRRLVAGLRRPAARPQWAAGARTGGRRAAAVGGRPGRAGHAGAVRPRGGDGSAADLLDRTIAACTAPTAARRSRWAAGSARARGRGRR